MSKLSHKVIIYIIGVLLLFNGGLMLMATVASWLMKDTVTFEMTVSAFVVMILGGFMMLISRNHEPQIHKERIFDCNIGMGDDDANRNDSLYSD